MLFKALVIVAALLLGSVSATAGDNSRSIRPLAEARAVLEHELITLAGTGFVGIAHSDGEGEIIVFVEDEEASGRVPGLVRGYQVRTEITGKLEALSLPVAEPAGDVMEDRQGEIRPLVGGTSLSALIRRGPGTVMYAGTLGMVTYDNKILSNAHVIAKEPGADDFLDIGTPLVQPGSVDGGTLADRVGELEAYIPIDFGSNAQNYADAAIGSIDTGISVSPGEQLGEGGGYWIQGWTEVSKGDMVRKSGRTTGVTTGQVVHTNASVWVTYGDQSAYFVDQIVVSQANWSFAAQGDSGSAVDKEGEFVGLLFSGSETHAVISKAEHIITGLGVAVEPLEGWYSLSLSSTAGGSVTVPGEGMFLREALTVLELVAEADLHHSFVRWTGDVDNVGDVYDAATNVTMDSSYSITASFELEEGWSSLGIASTDGGSVTEPGEGTFVRATGTILDLVAEADQHYRFVEWTGDVEAIGDVYAASTNVTMEDSCSIVASFELDEGWCSLTVSSTDGGSVTVPGEGVFIRAFGIAVDIVAEADEGYQFVRWSGDVINVGDVYAAATSISMEDSYSITARFESWEPDPQVQLTILSTAGGSVAEPGEGSFGFPLGTEVSLAAIPDEGYRFVGWSSEADTIADVESASTTITMDSSYSVTADFEKASGRCCIATAAYGAPMVEELQVLRDFRDGYLMNGLPGRAFVDFYYSISPAIAQFITDHPGFKPIVRAGLGPAVAMSAVVVNTSPTEKAAAVGLLALLSLAVMVWVTTFRGRASECSPG